MQSRRPMKDRSYRTRGTHTNRPLPDHMKGANRTTPRTTTYPTIPLDDEGDEG